MKLQVSSPILINLKKICQYNDDNMVQNAVYVIAIVGMELELNCLRDFVLESELNLN